MSRLRRIDPLLGFSGKVLLAVLWLGQFSAAFGGDVSGKVTLRGAKHSGDAVVYVGRIAGKTFDPPDSHAVMNQRNLKFIPHVLPILAGTTVDFANNDNVFHNIFSPDKCPDKFNLGTWPQGETRSHRFTKPGCSVVMLCNVHPEMEAYILVLETPYFNVSAWDGRYTIKDVPAGRYMLNLWHEKFPGSAREVTVPSAGEVVVNFDVRK
jgi:plastocyanin